MDQAESLYVEIRAITDDALLVDDGSDWPAGEGGAWIPKSTVVNLDEPKVRIDR